METTFPSTNGGGSVRQDFMKIIGQNTQKNHLMDFQISTNDVRCGENILRSVLGRKTKNKQEVLAVSPLCHCSKRIIIEMALVFNVFSFEIRRQLLKLILFKVSRRFIGG